MLVFWSYHEQSLSQLDWVWCHSWVYLNRFLFLFIASRFTPQQRQTDQNRNALMLRAKVIFLNRCRVWFFFPLFVRVQSYPQSQSDVTTAWGAVGDISRGKNFALSSVVRTVGSRESRDSERAVLSKHYCRRYQPTWAVDDASHLPPFTCRPHNMCDTRERSLLVENKRRTPVWRAEVVTIPGCHIIQYFENHCSKVLEGAIYSFTTYFLFRLLYSLQSFFPSSSSPWQFFHVPAVYLCFTSTFF